MLYFKVNISTPLSYFKSGQFISEKNWKHKPFIFENDYEIIVGVKGTIYIQQGDEKYEINPGDVLFLVPGTLHFGYEVSKEGSSFYWAHFLCNSEKKILNESEIYEEVVSILDKEKLQDHILIPTFFSLTDTGKSFIYLKQLLHITNSPYYTHLAANYLISELAIELTQQFITSFNSAISKENIMSKKFFDILEWIRINITKNISVEMVAHKFNFTPDHLTRLFKKNIGISTLKYINDIKINKAKEYLINSDKTIKEISHILCFKDEKYFMKLFKKYEGVTPSQFRDAYPKTYINTDSSDPEIPIPYYLFSKK
ncbi:AraC family transcriptional regulator [Clostridium sp. SHJSY1]|uniref:helix-turn-helix domain-containing protein n=1 Tax=Clostridium sp. SHJSY1 TaxID=2942483 RepID=UPI002875E9C4|nr:AraC family transcriptional regulator [Clostridium sp. SHJSY1]MDS0528300.1 AraC family transcriptional regulator [Clostridium sp. SHJSY1]